MSVKVSSWVWHGDETKSVSGNEMILLLALADVADDSGRCRFLAEDEDLSYASLARKARVSRSTLIRLIAKLREGGLLDQTKGVKGRPNEFQILVPWAQVFGSKVTPNALDSVSAGSGFGLISDDHTSYRRKNVSSASDAFDRFYFAYPRKVGRAQAQRSFEKAAKTADPEVIVDGARRFAADPNLPEKQYIPHPATWLNRGSWDDEPLPERDGPSSPAEIAEADDFTARRDAWLAARGITYEEYLEHHDEPGWLEAINR